MKKLFISLTFIFTLVLSIGFITGCSSDSDSDANKFTLSVSQLGNGSIALDPPGGSYDPDTEVTVKAVPDAGNGFITWGGDLDTGLTTTTITMDADKSIDGVFRTRNGYTVDENIEYAKPGEKSLKMDIYTPDTGKASYPVVMIIHGGGWSSNSEDIMNAMSQMIATYWEYVVVNIDYRWILADPNPAIGSPGSTEDIATGGNELNKVIEDAFGALAWIKENISGYSGDPAKIAVTGDSAGGHLAAFLANCSHLVGTGGFGDTDGVFEFIPTYLPVGVTADEVDLSVQAAAPAYGVFDLRLDPDNPTAGNDMKLFTDPAYNTNPAYYAAVSPITHIPLLADRVLPPQFCHVGDIDMVVNPAGVRAYVAALEAAGQTVEYYEHTGRNHAYLDTTPIPFFNQYFEKDAQYPIYRMMTFFDTIFYPSK